MNSRTKATPSSRPAVRSGLSYDAEKNPGLTGQYPSTNYTRIVDERRYQYPPPEAKEHPTRKPFPDMTSPDVENPNPFHQESGGQNKPKYASPPQLPNSWFEGITRHRGHSFNGFPSWAVPSSVLPQLTPPKRGHDPQTRDQHFVQAWDNRANFPVSSNPMQPDGQSTFDAAKWHDEFKSENIFRPDESQMRKSPSKTSRTTSKPAARGRAQSRATDEPVEATNGEKPATMQPGKLGDDFAARASGISKQPQARSKESSTDSRDRYVVVEEDAMDIDPPAADGSHSAGPNGINNRKPDSRTEHKRRSSHGGVDLRSFTEQAPFAPTSTGLSGLKDDLEIHLPFPSRAAKDLNLERTPSARIRALNLPKPPRAIIPPADDRLDKNNFDQYVQNMQGYMREWNIFNAKMIEHFRSRQDRVCGQMSQNWIGQAGDGPEAEILDQDENGDKLAGYGAYMQWLKDDTQCRDWWEEANEKHLRCLEDLGKVRETAKRKL
jgi:hypothetical protein